MILAVDTSSAIMQIAVRSQQFSQVHIYNCGLRHSEELMPTIATILNNAVTSGETLQGLVSARGPGSFHGLRIGMASLKAIGRVYSIPLVSVSVLDSMAIAYRRSASIIFATVAAPSGRYYTKVFNFCSSIGLQAGLPLKSYIDASIYTQRAELSVSEIVLLLAEILQSFPNSVELPKILLLAQNPNAIANAIAKAFQAENSVLEQNIVIADPVPWIESMLDLGQEQIEQGFTDEETQGPEYIRSAV